MNKHSVYAGASAIALLLTTSAFADSRPQDQTYRRNGNDRSRTESSRDYNRDNRDYNRDNRDNRDNRSGNSYRENDRVNLSGRITSFNRENNGYRIHLDRGPSVFVPESYYRRHSRDWRVGVSVTLGGIFRGGSVYVDDEPYYGNGYYSDGYLRGVVDRVDYRRGVVFLRDDRSGRLIEADLRGDRYGRLNIDDLRRGDMVELSGAWVRGDIFAVDRIDGVRSGRY